MTPELPPELVDQLEFIVENSSRFDRPQSFPFFPDDWLGSPGILTAHPAVEGAYIHLLAIEWGEVDLWLPSDNDSLATSSRLNSEWSEYAEKVLRFFYKHPFREGLVNHKLIEIRAKQLSYASRGQAGGLAKSLANGLAGGKLETKLRATPHPHPHPHPESPSPADCASSSTKTRGGGMKDPNVRAVMDWFYGRWSAVNGGQGFPVKSVPYPKEYKAAERILASYPDYPTKLTGLLDGALAGHYFAAPPDCIANFKPSRYTAGNRKQGAPPPQEVAPQEKSAVELMRERGEVE